MQENKMGVMPVKKLIVNMSVPMMISMLVQALYNVVILCRCFVGFFVCLFYQVKLHVAP